MTDFEKRRAKSIVPVEVYNFTYWEKFKNLAFWLFALIASLPLLAIPLLGFARTFGWL